MIEDCLNCVRSECRSPYACAAIDRCADTLTPKEDSRIFGYGYNGGSYGFHRLSKMPAPTEGATCPGCGRIWRHRDGDGGKDGPISIYHKSDCPYASVNTPTGVTETGERAGVSP